MFKDCDVSVEQYVKMHKPKSLSPPPGRHPGQNPHWSPALLLPSALRMLQAQVLSLSSQPTQTLQRPVGALWIKVHIFHKTLIFLYLLLPGRISGHRKVIIACLLCARHCSSAEKKVDNGIQLLFAAWKTPSPLLCPTPQTYFRDFTKSRTGWLGIPENHWPPLFLLVRLPHFVLRTQKRRWANIWNIKYTRHASTHL